MNLKRGEKKEKKSWRQDDATQSLTHNEQKEYKRLEKDIQRLEEKKEAIEAEFVTGELSQEEIQEKSIELQKIINESEEKTERWFELAAKMEE